MFYLKQNDLFPLISAFFVLISALIFWAPERFFPGALPTLSRKDECFYHTISNVIILGTLVVPLSTEIFKGFSCHIFTFVTVQQGSTGVYIWGGFKFGQKKHDVLEYFYEIQIASAVDAHVKY